MGLASRAGLWASPSAPSYPAVPLQLPGAWPRSCRQTFRPRLGLLRALVTRRPSVAPESWGSSLHPRPTLARRAALRSCAGPLGTLHPALDAGRGAERRRAGRQGGEGGEATPLSRWAQRPLGGNTARSPAYLGVVSRRTGAVSQGHTQHTRPLSGTDIPDQFEVAAAGVERAQKLEILRT